MNRMGMVQILFLLGAGNGRISWVSWIQNSWEDLKIHVLNYNTKWTILYTTGTLGASKQVHHWASMECYQRGALLSIL